MSKILDRIESVTGVLGNVLSGNVRATLESNVAPGIEIYGGVGGVGGAGLAKLLGIRAGVVVRDPDGRELARVGDPAAFEPLRALILVAGVAGAVFALVWLVRAARR